MNRNYRWFILIIVSSALLLIVLDSTILYTALPRLTHDLPATASEKLWIVNAYPLVMAGLLPSTGALGDCFGHKKIFIIGMVVFGIASLLAGFALSAKYLIFARVVLAIGAAMMMPATLSIIRVTFEDKRESSIALAIWASVASAGAGLGPLVGGVLLEHFWWGSVFIVNIPIIVLAIILGLVFIPKMTFNSANKWDILSSIQIMIGIVGIVFAIKEITCRGGKVEVALIAIVVGVIATTFFVRRQNKITNPLLDFSLFRNNKFSSGAFAAILASFALVGIELLLSQRLQLALKYSPLQAGLYVATISASAFVFGTLIGIKLHKLEIIKVQSHALFTSGIGLLAYLFLYNQAIYFQISCLIIVGAGIGVAMSAASNSIMINAPLKKAGMAASVEETSYEVGSALGIAILGGLLSFIYSMTISLPNNNISARVRDSLDEAILISEKTSTEQAQAIMKAANHAFDKSFFLVLCFVAVVLICSGMLLKYMQIKDKKNHNRNDYSLNN